MELHPPPARHAVTNPCYFFAGPYCASRPRFFRGLRLHLVATLHGLPLGWALTGAKADERVVCWDMLTGTPALSVDPEGHQTLIADKGYNGAEFEADLNQIGIELLRPTRKGEALRAGERFFKPLRQCVESIFDTFKGQLNLEQDGGRTVAGVCTRVGQRVLALTAAIWHNDTIGAPSYAR